MQDRDFKRPPHQGKSYVSVLERLHRWRRPATYLEIGTDEGVTLALARCTSIAIDPEFRLTRDVRTGKPECRLFEMTSDAFFAEHDPRALFGAPVDFAFIDGMHRHDFALRDFMNVERACRRDAIVVMHDCLPVDGYMARLDPKDRSLMAQAVHKVGWAGDTWKAIWILRRYRPDLRIHAFDAPPSGLVVVTGLNPHDTTLRARYDEALRAATSVTLEEYYSDLAIVPTAALRRPSKWARLLARVRGFDFRQCVRA